jgi:YD repeat-containing protein
VTSPVAATEQVLTGTKAAGTGVGINGSLLVPVDETTLWSATLPLAEGLNSIAIYGIDALGQRSDVIRASIRRDTLPPAIVASTPADGAITNALFDQIRITLSDASEIDYTDAIDGARVSGNKYGLIRGAWQQQGSTLVFTADEAFSPDAYQVSLPLADLPLGNSAEASIAFRIDDIGGATPSAPEITELLYDGAPLADAAVLTQSADIAVRVEDLNGISRVELFIDGARLGTDTSRDPYYRFALALPDLADGAHRIELLAFDSLGNRAATARDVTVALAAPAAPALTTPATDLLTNRTEIAVSGTAAYGSEVVLLRNGSAIGDPLPLDWRNRFSGTLPLDEGANQLQVIARNRGGDSAPSAVVTITVDPSVPPAPTGLIAETRDSGVIRLDWQGPGDLDIAGYDVYRAAEPFDGTAAATRITTQPITVERLDDAPGSDGRFYYRVVTVNRAGTQSEPSHQAQADADATPPRATAILYRTLGAHDPDSGRFGVGAVEVQVEVSESLAEAPFLSLTPDLIPEQGEPMPVALRRIAETTYSGQIEIAAETPSGLRTAVFSARDRAGNRGTAVEAGETLLIDTEGPRVTDLTITPADPIRNAPAPVTVDVSLSLSSDLAPDTTPDLTWRIDGDGQATDPAPIDLIEAEPRVWTGSLTLPATAGAAAPAALVLEPSATDDLGNPSAPLAGGNRFQVYQGELPPLEVPAGLAAEALPGGAVQLTWQPVDGAADYQLYRTAPGEADLLPLARSAGATELTDTTETDGLHRYAVASVRSANGQEGLSAPSAVVEALADGTPPEPPTGLTASLTAAGIQLGWTATAEAPAPAYRLYRAADAILDTAGIEPVLADLAAPEALDPRPAVAEPFYAVTAVDAAGNESAPTASVHLNVSLLPVAELTVTQQDSDAPVLRWTAPHAEVAGYRVHVLDGEAALPLHAGELTETELVDTGYTGEPRRYAVATVDAAGVEGPRVEVLLPALDALTLAPAIRRGEMNRLDVTVQNLGDAPIPALTLTAELPGADATQRRESPSLALGPLESRTLSLVLGGAADLPDLADLTLTLTAPTDTGGTARIIRTEAVEIGNGALAGDLLAAELTRGGTGQVRIRLTNSGSAEVQIVTALGHGAADSDEVRVLLTDTDGNLLATAPLRQGFGEQIQIGPDGRAIAGIAPGATFVSAPMALAVPSAIPDDVELLLVIDRLHHGLPTTVDAAPTPPPISIEGLTARRPLRLIDTAYRGDITAVTPEASLGGEPIRITGRAVERGTGYLLTHVPLDLVITVDGFERVFEVVTDGAGQFSHDFEPLPGEFGSYQVAAVHPDLSERPIQARFSIGQVVLSPQTYRLGAIRSQASEVPIRIETSPGAGLAGVRLHFDAADQPLGALPDGVSVSLPEAVDLGGGDSVQLAIGVTADEDAADTGTLILGLRSSDLGDRDLGTLRIDYSLTAARPALVFSPSYLETGVARDQSATETLRLENQGLATLAGVTLTLIDAQGDPAPSWLFLSSSAEPGDLSVGDAVDVGITAAPSSAVAEGDYEYRLRIDSGNADPVEINLYVAVSDAGVGAVRFHVADIYTETLDGDGTPIPGLAGASIRLQNEQVLSIDETLTTSANGEALFADLPAGRYKFRATAPNHQPVVGRLRVKPGVTLGQDIFLDYDLITVEWSVTEIPLQDRYEITLRTEYETDVPAPVVVMEPASVNLPADMEPGDVFHGQFTLTNYGLIRAEAMQLDIDSDAEYRVEVLGAVPAMLEPKQRVTVAYRVVLMDTGVNAEDASGGAESGCYSKRIRVGVTYEYRCVNGEWRWVAVPHYIWRVFGDCPSGPGVGGGSAGAGGGGGGGGGGGCCGGGSAASGRGGRGGSSTPSKPADRPKPEPIAPNYCVPEAPPEEPPLCPDDDQQVPAGSWVHAVIREYQDRMTDLTVKVPGGEAAISRRFYGDDWHWDHERTRLRLFRDLDSGLVREIERANVSYAPVVFGSDDVFRNDTYRIIREPDGFRWEDAGGNWERYDSQGRPVARGRDARTIVQLAYPDADATRPSALLDADGNSVFSFEYQGDLLSAVSDAHGRRVEYGYTGSRLTRVTDANGGIQGYSYDAKGRMTAKTDAEDRRISIGYTSTGEVASVLRADGTGTRFEYGWDDAAEERYARIQTSSGKETEVWYNADGDVLRTALNARPMRTVDEERRVRISTDEKGNVTRTTLDQWDKPLRVVYPDGSEVSYAYDNRFHKVRRQVDRRGIVTEYSYDARGNLTRRVEAVGLPEERATRYVYDAADQLLEQVQEADADTAEARTAFTPTTPSATSRPSPTPRVMSPGCWSTTRWATRCASRTPAARPGPSPTTPWAGCSAPPTRRTTPPASNTTPWATAPPASMRPATASSTHTTTATSSCAASTRWAPSAASNTTATACRPWSRSPRAARPATNTTTRGACCAPSSARSTTASSPNTTTTTPARATPVPTSRCRSTIPPTASASTTTACSAWSARPTCSTPTPSTAARANTTPLAIWSPRPTRKTASPAMSMMAWAA